MTDETLRALEKRVTALETRGAVDDVHRLNVTTRLDAIEDTLKWLVRLIIGALIMAAVGFALQGGFTL